MATLFMVCAIGGGVVLICQVVLTLVGIDSDSDIDVETDMVDDLHVGDDYVDAGHHSTMFFGVLTFRSLVAAVTFFGLGGLMAQGYGLGSYTAMVVGAACGTGAMLLVAWMMRMLMNLKSEGNVDIHQAAGQPATVYLTIPGENAGSGKVTVTVQNRTMEYEAVTAGETLPTGRHVVITEIVGPGTVQVQGQ